MSFLAALAKNTAKKGYAIPLIERELLSHPVSEDRRDKAFHPSDLSGQFCPRAWSLYNYHTDGYTVKEGGIDIRLARIFDNGHDFHARMQRYLGAHLWGKWEKQVGWDEKDQPVVLTHMGTRPTGNGWVYAEVRLHHGPDRILGSTDGLLNIDGEKWGLEGKSINSNGFKWLDSEAKVVHVNQTLIYEHSLEWIRKSRVRPMVDTFDAQPLKGFVILYENKDTQEFKEFVVKYDAAQVEDFMNARRPLMHEALEYERTGNHPECRCDTKKRSPLCKAFPDSSYLTSAA